MTMIISADSPKPITYTANITLDGHREYTAVWQALSDDVSDGPVEVLATAGLPRVNPPLGPSIFSFGNSVDYGAPVRSCQLRHVNSDDPSVTKHLLTYSYSSHGDDRDPQEQSQRDDPLQWPVEWSGSFAQFTRPFDQTALGLPIMNAAGDPFVDPPVEGDDSRPTIVAVKNYPSVNLSLWKDYKDAVNSDPFLGLQPGEVKVSNISWSKQFKQFGNPASLLTYFEVRFEFHISTNWKKEVLNAGFRELQNPLVAPLEISRIKGDDGLDVAAPWPLHFSGRALTPDEVQLPAGDLNGPNFLEFQIYQQLPFSALGLPSTIT